MKKAEKQEYTPPDMDKIKALFIKNVTILAHDKGVDGEELWEKYYKKEPSYANQVKSPRYYALMKGKYVKVYKLCLEEIDSIEDKSESQEKQGDLEHALETQN